ncbi:MAG: hypothetical protein ACFFDR_11685 [Candidatus Thorarchaeota archaeon]
MMSSEDKESRIVRLSEGLRSSSNLPDFESYLREVQSIDVIKSPEIRDALQIQSRKVFCLIRRSRIEGREPPPLDWVVTFQELLTYNESLNEMRKLRTLDEIFTEFMHILNSKKKNEIEIREVLRVLVSTPLLIDYAWEEMFKSSLAGLVNLAEKVEVTDRLILSMLSIGSILRNRNVMEYINTNADVIEKAITGKKNPDLATSLLNAISSLPGSPWAFDDMKGSITFDTLQENLQKTILGRFSKMIPEREKIILDGKAGSTVSMKVIEDMIVKLGWCFTRQYLYYLAEVSKAIPELVYPIVFSQEPMGRIQENYILYCLRSGIQLPYQILQSALGKPEEYVVDFDVFEADHPVTEFEADCPDRRSFIDFRNIREDQLINGRTGLRLDETYLGAKGIIRTLLDRNEQIPAEIAVEFLRGLLVEPSIPIAIKKRAKGTYERAQDR